MPFNVELCFNFLKPQDISHSSSSVWSEIFYADNDAKFYILQFPNAWYATGISLNREDDVPVLVQG